MGQELFRFLVASSVCAVALLGAILLILSDVMRVPVELETRSTPKIQLAHLANVAAVRLNASASGANANEPAGCPQAQPCIAVLVTGLVRIFKFRFIAELLKDNMVDALASGDFEVHTWLRVSLDDEDKFRNEATAGESPELVMKQVLQNIEILRPRKVVWYRAGSASEREEQEREFPHIAHRAARAAHPRVYSQLFHKYMNLREALRREVEANQAYCWYVHVRPDTIWVSPAPALRHVRTDRISAAGFWNWNLPDIALLVPHGLGQRTLFNVLGRDAVEGLADPGVCCYRSFHDGHSHHELSNCSQLSGNVPQDLHRAMLGQCCPSERELWRLCDGGEHALNANVQKRSLGGRIALLPLPVTISHLDRGGGMVDECWRLLPRFAQGGMRQAWRLRLMPAVACKEALAHWRRCRAVHNHACAAATRPGSRHNFVPHQVVVPQRPGDSFRLVAFEAAPPYGRCLAQTGAGLAVEPCIRMRAPTAVQASALAVGPALARAFFPLGDSSKGFCVTSGPVSGQEAAWGTKQRCLEMQSDGNLWPQLVGCDAGKDRQRWHLDPAPDSQGRNRSEEDLLYGEDRPAVYLMRPVTGQTRRS